MADGESPRIDEGGIVRRLDRTTLLVTICQVGLLVATILLWEFATGSAALNAFLFGSPSAIWGHLLKMAQDGSLASDTMVTGTETLLGFALGNLIGTLLGLALWY